MRYLIPALDDLGEMFNGRRIAPIEFYETGRKSLLTSFGYQGISMIAVAGRDVAARNALAGQIQALLIGAEFGGQPLSTSKSGKKALAALIAQGNALLAQADTLAHA